MTEQAGVKALGLRTLPVLFVLLWSTGFLGAKFGLPYAEPFTFLAIRMAIAAALLTTLALILRSPWPANPAKGMHIAISGVLVHAGYLGGVFNAIDLGMPAGVAALIVGLQPLLTAALSGWLLGERVLPRQWLGLVLGLIGVAMVLGNRLGAEGTSLAGALSTFWALLAITFGTIHQKRHCGDMDLITGGAIQYATSGLLLLLVALAFESMDVRWTGEFLFALTWLVLVLSVGAVGLLYTLIRRGAASRVASLFYLVPPVVAVVSYFLFGERLGGLSVLGMIAAMAGVWLVIAPVGKR